MSTNLPRQTKWGHLCSSGSIRGVSIWNMEYGIRNMSVLIPCQQPPFSDITQNFWITKTASPRSCNPAQKIWNKIEKSRKTGQNKKNLISICTCFLTAIWLPNLISRRETDYRAMSSPKFGIFLIFPYFPGSLSLKSFGNSWGSSYK